MVNVSTLLLSISSLLITVSAWTTRQTPQMALPSSETPSPLVTSRQPHKLKDGRGTFLGFRDVKDVPGLKSEASVLMPDGGLSPCVIRVLGVGGGGCNAVRENSY
jgi:hypothetical protein